MHNQSQLNGEIALDPSESLATIRRRHAPAQIFKATLGTVEAVARRMVASWQRQRQARATYVALRDLDTRTLRDLGFDRSEIQSVAAEAAGQIDSSRTRFAQALPGLPL